MASYKIVCATLKYPNQHEHIVEVGTGEGSTTTRRWTVAQVRSAMVNGDVFYTVAGANIALVRGYTCTCGYQTIKSDADATIANNLDNLRSCK